MIDSFPEEIRHDILFKLPIKCLIRCTLVCKSWKSIIQNSSFIRAHLRQKINTSNQHGTHLLLHGVRNRSSGHEPMEEVYNLHSDSNDFHECCHIDFQLNRMVNPANERFRVAGICDGLVCLADDIGSKMFNYIIWNPSIRKAVMLPWPSVTFTTHGPFEDSIGFGFDAMTNDYKVVRLVTLEEDPANPTVAEVYSLATGSWKSLGSVAPPCRVHGVRRQCFFNGAIHWAVEPGGTASAYFYFILAFDLGSELFREIMMPKGTEMHLESRVSVSGDEKSLALFTRYRDKNDVCSLDIWVMKEYCRQDSWTKLITLGPQGPQGSLRPQPLCFRKSGEVFLVLTSRRQTLVALDLVSQQCNDLGVFDFEDFCSLNYYEESLVLLNMENAVCC